MKWQKPKPEKVEQFYSILPKDSDIELRKMFGCPCAFINKKMFIAMPNNTLILKLSEEDKKDFQEKYHVDPKEGVDKVWEGKGVIYSQRLGAERTKSRLGKIIGTKQYKSMTIRSWNTTTKLLDMMSS